MYFESYLPIPSFPVLPAYLLHLDPSLYFSSIPQRCRSSGGPLRHHCKVARPSPVLGALFVDFVTVVTPPAFPSVLSSSFNANDGLPLCLRAKAGSVHNQDSGEGSPAIVPSPDAVRGRGMEPKQPTDDRHAVKTPDNWENWTKGGLLKSVSWRVMPWYASVKLGVDADINVNGRRGVRGETTEGMQTGRVACTEMIETKVDARTRVGVVVRSDGLVYAG
ncbi:uncharacterized protein EV420DRAFT_1645162 [Desarmillaria tabescens]|uniref:Uncharacterized protein n=1 Tax=Armillaria tabescens TaxID=1929756 RepID=A0AA39N1P8_ARMTA|nr:uncharacterized protein EV420DRAFT_1645162 [Desarmillaria tabescens]KAK0454263.1 hypothetical protein EV420DRAFT_1645162 [Desarmillaria tabescens]